MTQPSSSSQPGGSPAGTPPPVGVPAAPFAAGGALPPQPASGVGKPATAAKPAAPRPAAAKPLPPRPAPAQPAAASQTHGAPPHSSAVVPVDDDVVAPIVADAPADELESIDELEPIVDASESQPVTSEHSASSAAATVASPATAGRGAWRTAADLLLMIACLAAVLWAWTGVRARGPRPLPHPVVSLAAEGAFEVRVAADHSWRVAGAAAETDAQFVSLAQAQGQNAARVVVENGAQFGSVARCLPLLRRAGVRHVQIDRP